MDFPGGSDGKESAMWGTWVRSLGWEDPLEQEMATHSTEQPSGLQSMRLQRVRQD